MRACLILLSLAALAVPLHAEPRQWTVKVNESIDVQIDTAGDDVREVVIVGPSGVVVVTAKSVGDKKHAVLKITGKAQGKVELLADAVVYYQVLVEVLPADPQPQAAPGDIPVRELKKVPVEPPPTATPPAAKQATPKKVGAVTRPTLRPASPAMTASASTIPATNARRAAAPNSFGIATSGTFPASSPATIRTNAATTEPYGTITRAVVSAG